MRKNNIETYSLTVYSIDPSISLKEYSEKFARALNDQTTKAIIDNTIHVHSDDAEILYFSYTNMTGANDITWHKNWMLFFDTDLPLRSESKTGHGIIIVHDIGNDIMYALVFGRASWLIKNDLVFDYGVKMASRLFDGKSIETVSSKFFSMIKNKSIVDYKEQYNLQTEEGQAVDFIDATITEDIEYRTEPDSQFITKLLTNVMAKASAGYSYIKITLFAEEITLDLLVETILCLSLIYTYRERFKYPIMKKVDKLTSTRLDTKFLDKIKNGDNDFYVGIPFFGLDESDKFVFFDAIEKYDIKYSVSAGDGEIDDTHEQMRLKSSQNGELNAEDIISFIMENSAKIDDIRRLKIVVWINGEKRPTSELIKWLEVEINEEEKSYTLYNGLWVEFNEMYVECLDAKVQSLENLYFRYDPQYSFSEHEYDELKEIHKDGLIEAFSDSKGTPSEKGAYREFVYNYILSQKPEWHLFDRVIEDSIEVCDINVSGLHYIHVKFGCGTSIENVLRQSLFGVRYIYANPSRIRYIINRKGATLSTANFATVIFLSEYSKRITRISEVQSLKCKMTFIDWVNYTLEHNMTPLFIEANYYKDPKQATELAKHLEELNL